MPETKEILPGWHTETYCANLSALSREEAIRAIHCALTQLQAIGTRAEHATTGAELDNRPAIYALRECLKKAGHLGMVEEGR